MKQITFLLLVFSGYFLNAQAELDTIFYNKKWERIPSRDSASFYRLAEISENLYKFEDYYMSGTLQSEGQYIGITDTGNQTGVFKYYFENGQLESYIEYDSNKLNGIYKKYDSLGALIVDANYKQNNLDGKLKLYYRNKKIRRDETYKNGESLSSKCFNKEGNEVKCLPFEKNPEFIGGEIAMEQFLTKNIIYPKKAIKKDISGIVYVQFIVEKDGSLSSFKVIKSANKLLDEEAIRVLKKMPKWLPGTQYGELTRVYIEIPINFQYE